MKRARLVLAILSAIALIYIGSMVLDPIAFDNVISGGEAEPSGVVNMFRGADVEAGNLAIVMGRLIIKSDPVIITDSDWLAENIEAFQYKDDSDAGSVVGAVFLGMMGMPVDQHIATVYQDGVAIERFTCLSVDCINGLEGGMNALDFSAVGQPIEQQHQWFSDYDAYLEAYKAVKADSESWLTEPSAETPASDDGLTRRLTIVWPTEILQISSKFVRDSDIDPALRERVNNWAGNLTEGTGAEMSSVTFSERMPLWLLHNDNYVYDDNRSVALSDLSMRNITIHIDAPLSSVDEINRRFEEAEFEAPNLALIEPAVRQEFIAQGLDIACLPQCGSVHRDLIVQRARHGWARDPFWTISVWRLDQ